MPNKSMQKLLAAKYFRGTAKKRFLIAGVALVLLLGLGTVAIFSFPLEARSLQVRYQLWREGVVSFNQQGWTGYLKDGCQKGVPFDRQECSCVALLHGVGDDALSWKKVLLLPEENWRRMKLSHPLRIYSFNMPGVGGTPAPAEVSGYRARKQAEKLREILASLCPRWVVVGNSFGGWVGAWLGLDWPEGVFRLALLDPAGIKGSEYRGLSTAHSTLEWIQDFQKKAYFRPRELSAREWQAVVDHLDASNVKDILGAQQEEDYLDLRLPALRRPTLLLWGKADRVIPLSVGQQMRSLIPGVVWREASECGHIPQKECPLVAIQSIIDIINYGAM